MSAARPWLRLEGAAVLVLAATLYAGTGASWWLFAALFFVPDLAILAYAGGPRVGALAYNAVHTYAAYVLIAVAGLASGASLPIVVALIGAAHVGFDRALGYGLKLPAGFQDTHLGRIGKPAPVAA